MSERDYVQDLINALEEDENRLVLIVYHQGKGLIFKFRSIRDGITPYLAMIKRAIQEGHPQEEC